jgi:MoaA/NifB/PqqE/SkfB family radical SAM enzyme
MDQVRLLGGEPTLHPNFEKLIHMAVSRGKRIVLFTNGLMPERSLNNLLSLEAGKCSILVNANSFGPLKEDAEVLQKRKKTITKLGNRCQIGCTIFQPNCDLQPLIALIQETGCAKRIRLGLAQPIGDANQYLSPKSYPAIGHKIAGFVETAAKESIHVELDCGFVRCMFSEDDFQRLHRAHVAPEWHCSPIIDIDLEGVAFPCFPLQSFMTVDTALDLDARSLRKKFELGMKSIRRVGIYKECSTCPIKSKNHCSGGCLALVIKRMNRTPWQMRLPAQTANQIMSLSTDVYQTQGGLTDGEYA